MEAVEERAQRQEQGSAPVLKQVRSLWWGLEQVRLRYFRHAGTSSDSHCLVVPKEGILG